MTGKFMLVGLLMIANNVLYMSFKTCKSTYHYRLWFRLGKSTRDVLIFMNFKERYGIAKTADLIGSGKKFMQL